MNTRFKKALYVLTIGMVMFLALGAAGASARTVERSFSGTSQVNCDADEVITAGPFFPTVRAEVTSGVSGSSRTYNFDNGADSGFAREIGYTLSPSVFSPVFEETDIQSVRNQTEKIFNCQNGITDRDDDLERGQFIQNFRAEIIARGNILGLTYGSSAEVYGAVIQKALPTGSGIGQFSDYHEVATKHQVTGSPTHSLSVSGVTGGGNGESSSISVSGGGTVNTASINAFSILFDANGNAIGGPRQIPVSSCGGSLQYATGVTNPSTVQRGERRSRTVTYFVDSNNQVQTEVIANNDNNVSIGVLARTLSGARPVVYYDVPQALVTQGICSLGPLGWDPNTTAYICTPSISSGDILTLQRQNPGSTIQTYYAQEASAPEFPFPTQTEWNTSRSTEESFMFDYVMQVPLNMQSCSDTPAVSNPVPQDPLSCVVEVASTPNPALPGTGVVWTTRVSNALGDITYSWTGSDDLARSITKAETTDEIIRSYQIPGTKSANVSVENDGRTAICTQVIPVASPMAVTCAPNVTATQERNAVTWSTTVTGGQAPFSYVWSGTDSLSGRQSAVTKGYTQSGVKTASVVVTDALNRTQTAQCGEVVITPRNQSTPEYDLGVVVVGQGSVTGERLSCGAGTVNDCNDRAPEGEDINVVANAAPGWAFTGWSGALSGNASTASVPMTGDTNVVATFSQLPAATTLSATSPSCTLGAGKVTLSWIPSSGATGYIIQRATNSTGPFSATLVDDGGSIVLNGAIIPVTKNGSATTFTDTGLSDGTRYYYRITPVNAQGFATGATANAVSSNTCSLSCNVTAASPSGKATHTTNVNVTSSGTAVGTGTYAIDCGNGTRITGSTGQCQYPIPGAYTVSASVSKNGASPASCTTSVNVVPNNKVLSVTKSGGGSCTITAPGISCSGSGSDCTEGYTTGTTQTVRVTAASGSRLVNFGGDCSGSSCTVLMDQDRSVDARCERIQTGGAQACVIDLQSQNASQNSFVNGSNTIGYGETLTFQYDGDNVLGLTSFTSSPFTNFWTGNETASNNIRTKQVSGLTAQRNYTFAVQSTNAVGDICTDEVIVKVKPQTPGTGFDVSASCINGSPTAEVIWDRSALADSYLVSASTNGTERVLVDKYTSGCSGASCSYTHENLVAGNTYIYRLRADNEHGSSDLSATRSVTAPNNCVVTKPDLQVVSVALNDPSQFTVGDTNSLNSVITNNGNAGTGVSAWADRVTVRFPDGTETVTTGARSGAVAEGVGYAFGSNTFTMSQVGTYSATFCADEGGLVDESNETNNCRLLQFGVLAAPATSTPTTTPPVDVTVFPPISCSMDAVPQVEKVNSLITYTVSVSGGDGTYTYDWKDHTGADWGADTTTAAPQQIKTAIYNTANNYTPRVNISSWVGTSTSARFETIQCNATHTAQDPAPLVGLELEYTRECRNDGTIQAQRVTIDGWKGRNQWPITEITRTGSRPHPNGVILHGCSSPSEDCVTRDPWVQPGDTYTYSAVQVNAWPTSTSRVNVGTDTITIPANDCPVVGLPTCTFNVSETVTGQHVWASLSNVSGSNSFAWLCDDQPTAVNGNTWRGMTYNTPGTKACRVIPQNGPNWGRSANCSVEIKEAFECYATVDGERVTEAELGETVQWKYDINHPDYVANVETSYWARRIWHLLGADAGLEEYQLAEMPGSTLLRRTKTIDWAPVGLSIITRYSTTTHVVPGVTGVWGRRFSSDKDFFITYSTTGTKNMRAFHRINDGGGSINASREQQVDCFVNVVQSPLVNVCSTAPAFDEDLVTFPGAPTNPTDDDYQYAPSGVLTKGSKSQAAMDADIYDISIDKGDGSPIVTIRRTGAEIRGGIGLEQTYAHDGTFTPRTQVVHVENGQVSNWSDCAPVTVTDPVVVSRDFTVSGPLRIFIEQGEVLDSTSLVTTIGNEDPGIIDFSGSNNVEVLPGVTMTFVPVDCSPGLGSCPVQLRLTADSDAPGTDAPALIPFSAHSADWGVTKNKAFFLEVRASGLQVDMWTDDGAGDIKLKGVKDGTVRVEAGEDLFLKWETRKSGQVVTGGEVAYSSDVLKSLSLLQRMIGLRTARASGLDGGRLAITGDGLVLFTSHPDLIQEFSGSEAIVNITDAVGFRIQADDSVTGLTDFDTIAIEIISDPTFEEF